MTAGAAGMTRDVAYWVRARRDAERQLAEVRRRLPAAEDARIRARAELDEAGNRFGQASARVNEAGREMADAEADLDQARRERSAARRAYDRVAARASRLRRREAELAARLGHMPLNGRRGVTGGAAPPPRSLAGPEASRRAGRPTDQPAAGRVRRGGAVSR